LASLESFRKEPSGWAACVAKEIWLAFAFSKACSDEGMLKGVEHAVSHALSHQGPVVPSPLGVRVIRPRDQSNQPDSTLLSPPNPLVDVCDMQVDDGADRRLVTQKRDECATRKARQRPGHIAEPSTSQGVGQVGLPRRDGPRLLEFLLPFCRVSKHDLIAWHALEEKHGCFVLASVDQPGAHFAGFGNRVIATAVALNQVRSL
jgi:hypothetical protein